MEDQLKFPIGTFQRPEIITKQQIDAYIHVIETFPERLAATASQLTAKQLDTPYRPGGWTIRQVIHHCADSHMNSFARFKLSLTEDSPVIKPYYEDRWAELADAKELPIEPSLFLLKGLHIRWVVLLKSLQPKDLKRTFVHPQNGRTFTLDENIGLYAWHCNHHLAHITMLKEKQGWS
ncbi:bacillithiol transferase BstA [Olivibacter sp. CPCC 100613]|uniref:YfiT family bacillithiol transferase n=1 Tax=Olivibacter sp. CPCC 100613 TaxID=3079931 RepID=UPI002FF83795